MSEQIWVRPYDKDKDHKLLAEWLFALREKNRFDPEIFKKGQAEIYTCFDSTGPVAFIPVVNGSQVESLALKPGLSPATAAKAFIAWQHVFVYKLHEKNIPNAFFVTYDETVLKFTKNYGWKTVIVPMLNLSVNDLEGATDGRS